MPIHHLVTPDLLLTLHARVYIFLSHAQATDLIEPWFPQLKWRVLRVLQTYSLLHPASFLAGRYSAPQQFVCCVYPALERASRRPNFLLPGRRNRRLLHESRPIILGKKECVKWTAPASEQVKAGMLIVDTFSTRNNVHEYS
jgi:hypothetical protein